MSTKQAYTKKADLVTCGWIREEYKASDTYPVALKRLTTTYLKRIFEDWKPNRPECLTISNCDEGRTITHTCPIKDHYIQTASDSIEIFDDAQVAYGKMITSTEGAKHSWLFIINNVQSSISIGVCEENIIYYGLDCWKGDQQYVFQSVGDLTHNELDKYYEVYNPDPDQEDEAIDSGDHLLMRMHENIVNFYLINGKVKCQTQIKIQHGVNYKIFVSLNNVGDSVTIKEYFIK